MNGLSNNNNVLSDEALNRVLIVADNLSREGQIRFKAGIPETATIGKVDSLKEIFGKALVTALSQENLFISETELEKKLSVKGSLRETYEGAREPCTRRIMIDQLRGLLTAEPAPAVNTPPNKERALAFV